mmetsp:Transcript_39290/g.108341  ORF Transcript_39290/g.108341 Transcript_39290/m.108341 type:complete len:131 (-) Transcript_39290:1297-1689(-)
MARKNAFIESGSADPAMAPLHCSLPLEALAAPSEGTRDQPEGSMDPAEEFVDPKKDFEDLPRPPGDGGRTHCGRAHAGLLGSDPQSELATVDCASSILAPPGPPGPGPLCRISAMERRLSAFATFSADLP